MSCRVGICDRIIIDIRIPIQPLYPARDDRIRLRKDGTLSYLFGDHLGSTSLVTDAAGNNPITTLYKAWGEVRYSSGNSPTNYTFTGQYSNMGDFGLMFYNARWYDPSLGRFAQADTIIPGGAQGLDRYAYTTNNPVRYTDPTGHRNCEEDGYNCPGDKGPFPKPNPSPTVILVCGFGVNCNKNNTGSLDEFEKLGKGDAIRISTLYKNGGKYDAASELLDKINNIQGPIILVGHSAGADAIILALSKMSAEQKQKMKGVILIDPSVTAGCHADPCTNGEIDYSTNGSLAPLIKDNLSNPPLFIYDSNLDEGIDMRKDEYGGFSPSATNYHYHYDEGIDHMKLATSGPASEKVLNLAVSTLDLFNYQYYRP